MIGLDQNFAGFHIDHVGRDVSAFEIVGSNFHLLDLVLLDFAEDRVGDLAALRDHLIASVVGEWHARASCRSGCR